MSKSLDAEIRFFVEFEDVITASFSPRCPSGVSMVEHYKGLAAMIINVQMLCWERLNAIPKVLIVGHFFGSFLCAGEPLRQTPPGRRLGALYGHTEVLYGDDESGIGPAEAYLVFAEVHENGQRGEPVATISIDGFEESALKKLARQAQ